LNVDLFEVDFEEVQSQIAAQVDQLTSEVYENSQQVQQMDMMTFGSNDYSHPQPEYLAKRVQDNPLYALQKVNAERFELAKMCFMGVYSNDVGSFKDILVPKEAGAPWLVDSYLRNFIVNEKKHMGSNLNWKQVKFTETSKNNNVIMQIFEFPAGENTVNKLAIVDGGTLFDDNPYGPDPHLFYVGKLYGNKQGVGDLDGAPTQMRFVNIFKIILHDEGFENAETSLANIPGGHAKSTSVLLDRLCNLTDGIAEDV
jgi:hypothetical protein